MGVRSKALAGLIGSQVAPRIGQLAPGLTTSFVREALQRAIAGVGPLPGAAAAADAHLRARGGDEVRAVHDVIESHVRLAGGQGFVTNLGGLVTAPVTMPANIAGLAVVQCRMVAGIAHLRGHDLSDAHVRAAVTLTLLGEDKVTEMVAAKQVTGTPYELATSPSKDPRTEQRIAAEVAGVLVARMAGKQVVSSVGRRVPLVGGVVGAGADGFTTWKVGRYADAEFLPRARR